MNVPYKCQQSFGIIIIFGNFSIFENYSFSRKLNNMLLKKALNICGQKVVLQTLKKKLAGDVTASLEFVKEISLNFIMLRF